MQATYLISKQEVSMNKLFTGLANVGTSRKPSASYKGQIDINAWKPMTLPP